MITVYSQLSEEQKEKRRTYSRERARRLRQNPEYRQLELERNRRWQKDNSEQYAESKRIAGRNWYEEHREEKQEKNKTWKAENRDRVNEMGRIHNARRRAIVSGSNEEIGEYIAVISFDPCSYCGSAFEHVDHIVPLSGDGEHDWDNLTASCGDCNHRKFTKPLLEFMLCQ